MLMVALHFLDLLKSTRRSARDISIIYIFLKNLHTKKAARRTKGSGEIRSHVIDSLLLSTLRAAECGFYHGRNFTLPIILMKYARSHFHFPTFKYTIQQFSRRLATAMQKYMSGQQSPRTAHFCQTRS